MNSDLHNTSLVTVIGGEEEHFEDFGESNNSELPESNEEDSVVHLDSPLSEPPVQVDGSSVLSPRLELITHTSQAKVRLF